MYCELYEMFDDDDDDLRVVLINFVFHGVLEQSTPNFWLVLVYVILF